MKKEPPVSSKRDAAKTRASILIHAAGCFARSGFHGTPLSLILKKARVNKRMIYHYFGSKKGLYQAVHLKEWQELEKWFLEKLVQDYGEDWLLLKKEKLLLKALEIYHDFTETHQLFIRLLLWDTLEGGKVSNSLWKDIRGPLYYKIEAMVLQAQRDGVIPKELKANHLVISFMGAIVFYFTEAHTLKDIFQHQPLSKAALKERKEQTLMLFGRIFQKG